MDILAVGLTPEVPAGGGQPRPADGADRSIRNEIWQGQNRRASEIGYLPDRAALRSRAAGHQRC
jgi:hypothetical protein